MNYTALLSLSALLMMIIGSACASDDPSRNPVIVTVMTAEVGGILAEENGCLRITDSTGGDAIVWQKDVLKIERQGDTLLIARLHDENAQTVTWKLGDMVRGGGGEIRAQIADDHAGAGFSERCPGPYFMVGTVK